MDLDAEMIKLRRLTERVEPVLAEYEARQGDGMGTPKGYTPEQWAELSRMVDRLDMIETRLAPWEQGEKDIPPGIQDLAQRIIERVDRLEVAFANIEAKLAEFEKIGPELSRLTRMTADLAEIVENKAPLYPLERQVKAPGASNGEAPLGAHGHE